MFHCNPATNEESSQWKMVFSDIVTQQMSECVKSWWWCFLLACYLVLACSATSFHRQCIITVQSTYTWHCNFSVENDHRNSRHWLFLVIMCDLMCFLFSSENKLHIAHVWPFLTFGSFRFEDRHQKQTAIFDWEMHYRMWRCKVKGFDKKWL